MMVNTKNKMILLVLINLMIISAFVQISTRTKVVGSPTTSQLEISLNNISLNNKFNFTHYYNNFSFLLYSEKIYVYIASVTGVMTLKDRNENISLKNLSTDSPIGLVPKEAQILNYSSELVNRTFNRKDFDLVLAINFQNFVVVDENDFGKIQTVYVTFNETTFSASVDVPFEASYYSFNLKDNQAKTNSLIGFEIPFVIIFMLFPIALRLRKRKTT